MRPQAPSTRRLRVGRFSTGFEQRPPGELRLGRFSRGVEQLPDAPGTRRVGRFSSGSERRPRTLRRGSFADGLTRS
jgi:hypothetical protein